MAKALLFFSFLFSIVATEIEYPVLINPDGSIQPREFSASQKKTFDFLKKDIQYYQDEISKILPYLVKNGKTKNNTFELELSHMIETQPGRRNQHFVTEHFILKIKEGRISSISFLKRRTRLSSKMESETVIRTISHDLGNQDLSTLKLQIDTHTNFTEVTNPISRVFSFSEIPSPVERIRLLRTYREKVELAMRELDRIINRRMVNDKTLISNTLNDVEIE